MTQLPCPHCGAELLDGEETTTITEHGDFEFQGKPSVAELPARECPDCGEVTAL